MIRVKDAALLAYTKLRTRKIRLIVTIVISGLLVSILAGASFVVRGAFKSIEDFNEEGYGRRYILSAQVNTINNLTENQAVIDRAIVIQKDLVARKKVVAKQLGIEYDPTTEIAPYTEFDNGSGKTRMLEFTSPSAKQAIAEYAAEHPEVGLPELKKSLEKYSPQEYYESTGSLFGMETPYLQVLKNGKEDYSQDIMPSEGNPFSQTGIDSFVSSWGLMSGKLLEPFQLPGTSRVVTEDGSIPVVAPYTAVEELLSLEPLSPTASSEDRLERIKTVREKAPNLSFTVCYRNKTSQDALTQAIGQQQEINQNKDNKNYQKPALVKDVPAEACGQPRTVIDKRTAAEKTQIAKQQKFEEAFGKKPEATTVMKFHVIGIAPDPPNGASAGVADLLTGLLGSYIGATWYSPLELRDTQPLIGELFRPSNSVFGGSQSTYYAELSDSETARKVLESENCVPDYTHGPTDPFAVCAEKGKHFMLIPFGSSSLALESAQKGFEKFFSIVAVVIAIVAALIMLGTIGRIISDSRRETAVFRAIGAKRLDIAQIYLTFTVMLTLLISGFALMAGFILSQIAQAKFADSLTVNALVAYNAQDLTKRFNLYAFEPRDLLYLVGITVVAGLLGALLPLLSNVRRSPIKDMRDEN